MLIVDLGLIGYAEAYAVQRRIVAARKAGAIADVLLFCEHSHVITQGRNGKREHLLAGEHVLRQKGVEFFETSRGGDITYHGPGQIVGYPILDLGVIRRDVVWYVRMLEEAMIRATAEFGIAAHRESGKTGIWVMGGAEQQSKRDSSAAFARLTSLGMTSEQTAEKLGAIGIHVSRWVTSHGFAYNVSTDLRYFDLIVPCGIADRKATSLEKLLGTGVSVTETRAYLAKHLADVFGLAGREVAREELFKQLETAEAVPVSA
jgi:lipoyl(octanoyl) transferase